MQRAMPVRLRDFLWPAIMAIAMISTLAGLGAWQIARGHEKTAMIAALDARIALPSVALPPPHDWPKLTQGQDEFRRVTFIARFVRAKPALIFTTSTPLRRDVNGPGHWVFAPAQLVSGETIIINRGYLPENKIGEAEAVPEGPVTITGYIRFAEEAGLFTPAPDGAKRLFYARMPGEMAHLLGWGNVAPFYIDMEGPKPSGAGPLPGALTPKLPDNHRQYAATWFALAAIFTVLFGIWIRGRVRGPAQ